MTNFIPSAAQPGFLKKAFYSAKVVGCTLVPVIPTLSATTFSKIPTADASVINGLVMGVSFCASMAFNNKANFPSLTEAYEYYSDKNYDSHFAAAMMALFYTELTLLNALVP